MPQPSFTIGIEDIDEASAVDLGVAERLRETA